MPNSSPPVCFCVYMQWHLFENCVFRRCLLVCWHWCVCENRLYVFLHTVSTAWGRHLSPPACTRWVSWGFLWAEAAPPSGWLGYRLAAPGEGWAEDTLKLKNVSRTRNSKREEGNEIWKEWWPEKEGENKEEGIIYIPKAAQLFFSKTSSADSQFHQYSLQVGLGLQISLKQQACSSD